MTKVVLLDKFASFKVLCAKNTMVHADSLTKASQRLAIILNNKNKLEYE